MKSLLEKASLTANSFAAFCSERATTHFQLGGLDVILSHLSGSTTSVSIEAAGVLTQLTNPQHSFVQLHNVGPILVRLLDLIDSCSTGETLLLVSAALSNVSMQDPQAVDILYQNNAIIRLISAYNRQDCSTIFVQEQIVTVLSRLAARRYEEALVSQGAVPVLLEMLTVTDSQHSDYCRRIRYKLGGLDVILSHLSGSTTSVSIEAAGVLTQLTNPQHSFVQLHNVGPILVRLLDLIDSCSTGETLLLVSAALSNVSMQDPQAVDILYQYVMNF
ncbi:hypothetical protein OESDEN_06285 [Oesophagostomum dentatum]|uniref:Protein inscuteable homologue C-terminal domain-containing protein n=1 Tax=Oesophagostomum dentatum TaxID=61180 RepID=A0A0B1T8B1_OESDE|nr:hypothetical protein OESDEN_06285 [Oesophagostomum dentatum]